MNPLISIIMPVFNAENYIDAAIRSVQDQSYEHWELVIVNDGSTDGSEEIISTFGDERIKYFSQENRGVSTARNQGLENMSGDYFCFLDADDLMTKNSLVARLSAFEGNDRIAFVGGGQVQKSEDLSVTLMTQIPTYIGPPRAGLVSLDQKCFINCGTWLIRRKRGHKYSFEENMSHSEDICFFLSISDHGDLVSIPDVVQEYRRHDLSAMNSLKNLESGYRQYYNYAVEHEYLNGILERARLVAKIKKIMTLSYLANGNYLEGLKMLFASLSR